jgi:hypothetical protein
VAVYGGRDGDRVVRIDSRTNRIAANVPVEGDPYELAAGEGSVWVMGNSEEHGHVLHRIDPRTKPGGGDHGLSARQHGSGLPGSNLTAAGLRLAAMPSGC